MRNRTSQMARGMLVVLLGCVSACTAQAAEFDWRSLPAQSMAKPSRARDQCDRLAGDRSDLQARHNSYGTDWDDIDIDVALEACKRALAEAPADPLLNFQYGRVLMRKGSFTMDSQAATAAVGYMKKAAEAGHRHAVLGLGQMYENGIGVPRNLDTALQFYQAAVDTGYPPALVPLSCLYKARSYHRQRTGWNGFASSQMQRDLKQFETTATTGSLQAAFALGEVHEDCLGGTRHDDGSPASRWGEAAKWYTLAANRGSVAAMVKLAVIRRDGSIADGNPQEAVKWATMAARLGHNGAMNVLGALYWEGEGVPVNEAAAVAWWKKAAALGNEAAMENLEIASGNAPTTTSRAGMPNPCEKWPELRMCGGNRPQ